MHSSALGATALMVFRSFSSVARFSSLKAARYSSMVLGLFVMVYDPSGETTGHASRRGSPCGCNNLVIKITIKIRTSHEHFMQRSSLVTTSFLQLKDDHGV